MKGCLNWSKSFEIKTNEGSSFDGGIIQKMKTYLDPTGQQLRNKEDKKVSMANR